MLLALFTRNPWSILEILYLHEYELEDELEYLGYIYIYIYSK